MFASANMQSMPHCQQSGTLFSDITTVWLRKYDPTSFTYHKNSEVYVPKKIEQPNVCYCGLNKERRAKKCLLCSSQLYQSIERSAEAGVLDPYICNLLSVTS